MAVLGTGVRTQEDLVVVELVLNGESLVSVVYAVVLAALGLLPHGVQDLNGGYECLLDLATGNDVRNPDGYRLCRATEYSYRSTGLPPVWLLYAHMRTWSNSSWA